MLLSFSFEVARFENVDESIEYFSSLQIGVRFAFVVFVDERYFFYRLGPFPFVLVSYPFDKAKSCTFKITECLYLLFSFYLKMSILIFYNFYF